MLSRLFWISAAGIALIAGMALQDGGSMFSWGDRDDRSWHQDRAIEARVERAIEGSFDKMHVIGTDGREVEVPVNTKRAMADAVEELVKAEAELAVARVGEDDEDQVQAAQARRTRARAEIDRLKAEFKALERAGQSDKDALREEIRREIKEDVRETVRDAVRG